jgi:hypothetical protein
VRIGWLRKSANPGKFRNMPYKDPNHKAEWERVHRQQRLARRRDLRRIEAAREAVEPTEIGLGGSMLPLLGVGGALALSNPWLGLSAGSLTLSLAAIRKANWRWWVIGAVAVLLSLCVLWNQRNPSPKTPIVGDRDNEK